MNTAQRIAKNAGVLLASQVVSYVFSFFYVMYTARYLGAEGYGVLSFAIAFTGIFGVFSDLGISPLIVREIARDESLAVKYVGNIIVIKIFLVMITFGLIALTINILDYPSQTIKVVYLIALSVIIGSISNIFNSVFQAYEGMEYVSVGRVLSSSFMLIGAFFAINFGFDIVGFASIYCVTSLIFLGYSFVICAWKYVSLEIEADFSFWNSTIREALPFGLTSVSGMIYTYIDSIMLSLMKGDEVVGWYSAAYRLVLCLLFIPSIINTVVFPSMSRFYYSSENSLKFMCEKYFKYMIIVAIPIGVGTLLLADRVILLIFGDGYVQSIIALRILIWSLVITFIGSAYMQLHGSINRQIIVAKVSGICVAVNIILNLLLIPKFSYIGASVATVITEFILVMVILISAYKMGYGIQNKKLIKIIFNVFTSSLIMCGYILYFCNLDSLILILSAILLYFIALYIIGGFDKDDVNLFKQVIRGVMK